MEKSLQLLDTIKQQARYQQIEIWGPLPALIARRADRLRAQLVLLCSNRSTSTTRSAFCVKRWTRAGFQPD